MTKRQSADVVSIRSPVVSRSIDGISGPARQHLPQRHATTTAMTTTTTTNNNNATNSTTAPTTSAATTQLQLHDGNTTHPSPFTLHDDNTTTTTRQLFDFYANVSNKQPTCQRTPTHSPLTHQRTNERSIERTNKRTNERTNERTETFVLHVFGSLAVAVCCSRRVAASFFVSRVRARRCDTSSRHATPRHGGDCGVRLDLIVHVCMLYMIAGVWYCGGIDRRQHQLPRWPPA